jgi:hypothetical protein
VLVVQLGVLQDIAFTGNLDAALKWCIKNRAQCIDELETVEAMAARLLKIKDAVVNEKNEDAAEFRLQCPTGDDGENAALSADEDDVIKAANQTKYPENGLQYWQALAAQVEAT